MKDDAKAQRAKARGSWPVKILRPGETPEEAWDSLTAGTAGTAEERLAMVWQITLDTWTLSGRPMPTYSRHDTPIRIIRPGETPPDDEDSR